MARTMKTRQAALLLLSALLLSACGQSVAPVARAVAGSGSGASDNAPAVDPGAIPADPQPSTPDVVPGDTPVNLPPIPTAPTTPVDPAQMKMKAVAETTTNVPIPTLPGFSTVLIRAKLTWTPVKGAANYRIFENIPSGGQQAPASQYTVKDASSANLGKMVQTLPGWAPIFFVGGGSNLFNLKVGQEYDFTIQALDRLGNVMAQGQDNCMPLAPLSIPYLTGPAQNATQIGATPYFSWNPSQGADGYYVEAFTTIANLVPALPVWRAFRSDASAENIMYGQQVDVFEGTAPIQWVLPLSIGRRYAWTVCAIRTDTGNMQEAKAIARATAAFSYFVP